VAGALAEEPRAGRQLSEREAWQKLEFPAKLLPVAMKAFKTPDQARRWIEVLGRLASRPEYLRAVEAAGLRPEVFIRWREAGLNAWSALTWPKRLTAAGLGPENVKRWMAAQWDVCKLPPLLPYLSADLNFEEALSILTNWMPPRGKPTITKRHVLIRPSITQYSCTIPYFEDLGPD
jgi:hypothetical protein